MPPQVGQATTFSWVWLRRCSRSLQWSLKVQAQPGKQGPVMLQPQTQSRLWYPQVSADSSQPCPQDPSHCSSPSASPGFLQRPEVRAWPTFPAAQHHVAVFARCSVLTTQAVRLHVPVEPLRVVEGALCRTARVRTERGRRDTHPMCPRGLLGSLPN